MLSLQEVRRAGEHTAPADALKLLLWELHGALLAVIQQLLLNSSANPTSNSSRARPGSAGPRSSPRVLTEKGVLQLLFDQRFMRDVLGGGRPLAAVTAAGGGHLAAANGNGGGAEGDLAARKRLVSSLEQQLQVSHAARTCGPSHKSRAALCWHRPAV